MPQAWKGSRPGWIVFCTTWSSEWQGLETLGSLQTQAILWFGKPEIQTRNFKSNLWGAAPQFLDPGISLSFPNAENLQCLRLKTSTFQGCSSLKSTFANGMRGLSASPYTSPCRNIPTWDVCIPCHSSCMCSAELNGGPVPWLRQA